MLEELRIIYGGVVGEEEESQYDVEDVIPEGNHADQHSHQWTTVFIFLLGQRTFGSPATQPERYQANSPDRYVDKISTPMLVIHGDKDYRVPVSEALRLWWDLQSRSHDVKFLYFPDENHWILSPGHATVWYQTVLAFLAQYVLSEPWQRPGLL